MKSPGWQEYLENEPLAERTVSGLITSSAVAATKSSVSRRLPRAPVQYVATKWALTSQCIVKYDNILTVKVMTESVKLNGCTMNWILWIKILSYSWGRKQFWSRFKVFYTSSKNMFDRIKDQDICFSLLPVGLFINMDFFWVWVCWAKYSTPYLFLLRWSMAGSTISFFSF